MILIENLTKRYTNTTALEISNLTISEGDLVGLSGNNGSGKSTFLKILTDLIRPTQGTISINDINIHKSESWKIDVNSYLDDHSLINFLTPEEFFEITASLKNVEVNELNNLMFDLKDFFAGEILDNNKKISDFSRGNRQKIGIASAFIGSSKLLLLDEPLSNLDNNAKEYLANYLIDLNTNKKTTIIVTSHDHHFLNRLCSRTITLENGFIKSDIIH